MHDEHRCILTEALISRKIGENHVCYTLKLVQRTYHFRIRPVAMPVEVLLVVIDYFTLMITRVTQNFKNL